MLPNPAPEVESTAARRPPGTFVFVGRLTRQKALDVAIDAVAQVPEARLVVVGDGPDRAQARERVARELRPRSRIDFRGALPRAEALALVRAPRRAA